MSVSTKLSLSHIVGVITRIGNNPPTVLGRWGVKPDKPLSSAITHANEDHCGACVDSRAYECNSTDKNNDLLEAEYVYMINNTPN